MSGRDAGGFLFGGAELLVRGGGGMNHQAAGVADVGEMREELQPIDELLASLIAALDAEREHGSGAFRRVLLRQAHDRGCRGGDAYFTHSTPMVFAGAARRRACFARWRSMRMPSVSMPCRNRNELKGLMQGPISRRPSTRALMMKADGPEASQNFMP